MRQPHSILNWSILQFVELRMVRLPVYRVANVPSSSLTSREWYALQFIELLMVHPPVTKVVAIICL
jgi:hypothetical protein